jgi:hypothetical protein
MKREVRLLRQKATDALLGAVDRFNTSNDRGRSTTVLIMLDHGMEMLLKAAILHKGGSIRDKGASQTIGFGPCVRRALTDARIKFLTENDALTLQIINGHRDAAQHHLLDLSEEQLYLDAQAGVTLFRDLHKRVFAQELPDFPSRVLLIAAQPPKDLLSMIADEVQLLCSLLRGGKRRRVEARARLRGLAVMEAATRGEYQQPHEQDLDRALNQLASGAEWSGVFPGVASLAVDRAGDGPHLALRIAKREGVPVELVPEGTPGASVVAIKRVNELDFYSLGHREVAKKVGLTPPKTTAVIRALELRDDPDYHKAIQIGQVKYERYSPKAVDRIRKELPNLDMDALWREYGPRRK